MFNIFNCGKCNQNSHEEFISNVDLIPSEKINNNKNEFKIYKTNKFINNQNYNNNNLNSLSSTNINNNNLVNDNPNKNNIEESEFNVIDYPYPKEEENLYKINEDNKSKLFSPNYNQKIILDNAMDKCNNMDCTLSDDSAISKNQRKSISESRILSSSKLDSNNSVIDIDLMNESNSNDENNEDYKICIYCEEIYKNAFYNDYHITEKPCIYCNRMISKETYKNLLRKDFFKKQNINENKETLTNKNKKPNYVRAKSTNRFQKIVYNKKNNSFYLNHNDNNNDITIERKKTENKIYHKKIIGNKDYNNRIFSKMKSFNNFRISKDFK